MFVRPYGYVPVDLSGTYPIKIRRKIRTSKDWLGDEGQVLS
jgi:hypothetical protein